MDFSTEECQLLLNLVRSVPVRVTLNDSKDFDLMHSIAEKLAEKLAKAE